MILFFDFRLWDWNQVPKKSAKKFEPLFGSDWQRHQHLLADPNLTTGWALSEVRSWHGRMDAHIWKHAASGLTMVGVNTQWVK